MSQELRTSNALRPDLLGNSGGAIPAPSGPRRNASMEQKDRIEQLKEEVQRLAGGQAVMGGIERLPPEIAEQFLERVIAVEKEEIDRRKREAN
jgi:hypothetical protein